MTDALPIAPVGAGRGLRRTLPQLFAASVAVPRFLAHDECFLPPAKDCAMHDADHPLDPPHTRDVHDHDRGLVFDLPNLMARRKALLVMGGAGLAALVGCSSSGADGASTSATSTTSAAAGAGAASTTGSSGTSGATEIIPEETAGPFPGDGSNGPDVLRESGVVRRDITSSFAGSTGTAAGVPLVIELVVADAASSSPRSGAAVYAWHCDSEGRYSMYSSGVEDQNYLRGVQETDADGVARFTSIFPGCYDGRWPHVHFEVYASVDDATGGGSPIATSQIALPEDTCTAVYASDDEYSASVSNLSRVSLESDMVFADSYDQELGTVTGAIGDDLTVSLPVGV